jgi:esterase/lipase superfamily enzyme/HEAT repeat protein
MFKAYLAGPLLLVLLAVHGVDGQQREPGGLSANQWSQLLTRQDPRQRAQAAKALGALGPGAKDAVAALARALHDADPDVRLEVATALGRIGGAAVAALPQLVAGLKDDDEYVRYASGWALDKVAAGLLQEADGIPAGDLSRLVAQLKTAETALRDAGAAEAVERMSQVRAQVALRMAAVAPVAARPSADVGAGRLVPGQAAVVAEASSAKQLLRTLPGQDALGRVRTVHAMAQLGDAAVPALIEAIRIEQDLRDARNEHADSDDDVDISAAILEMLQRLGPQAAPALVAALELENFAYHVSYILEQMGPEAVAATPALIAAVKDRGNDEQFRDLAADALGAIGPRAREAVPVLIRVFSDVEEAESLRCTAALALGKIGEDADEAAPHLIVVLSNEADDDSVRSDAITALSKVGAPAAQAVPALLSLFENPHDVNLWSSALQTLAEYESAADEAVPVLVGLLDQEDPYLRSAAARALADIGRTPSDAQAALFGILLDVDSDDDAQAAAAAALAGIGPPAVAALIDQLDAADQHDAARAAAALARIGPDAAVATNRLKRMLRDEGYGRARRYAAIALGEFGPAAREAVDDLLAVVTSESEYPQLRGISATALGELGAVAEAAVPGLLDVIQDAQAPGNTRALCALAVVKISPKGIPVLLDVLEGDDPVLRVAAARALESVALVEKHALPALLDLQGDPRVEFLPSEVVQEMGHGAVWHLLSMIRDEQVALEERRRAVQMLGNLYLDEALRDRAVQVLIEAFQEQELREEVTWALGDYGTSAVPQVLAALEREERTGGDDTPLSQTLRRLAVELCIPTGRGGGGGGYGEPTGFSKYDALDIYNPPVAMAKEAAPPTGVDMRAMELLLASEGDEPLPQPVAEAAEAHGIAAIEDDSKAYETVKVFYGTNRAPVGGTLAPAQAGAMPWHFLATALAGIATMFFGVFGYLRSRAKVRAALAYCGMLATVGLAYASVLATTSVDPAAATPAVQYGSRHSDVVEMGVCRVTIPKTHEKGQLESPSLLKFEVRPDPEKHIVLKSVERRAPDQFYDELRDDLDRHGDSILVFIHGYNVTFENAARRTAQMAKDLEFQGAPVFYSWPSHGNWYRYREDEQQVELAVDHMRQFLVDVARRSQAGSIHLIAHSMGSRALTAALREIEVRAGERGALFNQVVLAAPDINAEVFKTRIAPAIVERAERVTLYASSGDLALAASRLFNTGGPRAGDSTDGPLVVPGIETIDVTDVDASMLGHSYYGSNRLILDDLRQLFAHAQPAAARRQLQLIARGQQRYWVCQPTETAAGEVVSPDLRR